MIRILPGAPMVRWFVPSPPPKLHKFNIRDPPRCGALRVTLGWMWTIPKALRRCACLIGAAWRTWCRSHGSGGAPFGRDVWDDLDGPVSIGLSWSRIRYALRAAERTRTSLSFERAPKSHRGAFAPSLLHYNGTLSAISYLCLSTLRG